MQGQSRVQTRCALCPREHMAGFKCGSSQVPGLQGGTGRKMSERPPSGPHTLSPSAALGLQRWPGRWLSSLQSPALTSQGLWAWGLPHWFPKLDVRGLVSQVQVCQLLVAATGVGGSRGGGVPASPCFHTGFPSSAGSPSDEMKSWVTERNLSKGFSPVDLLTTYKL